MKSLRTLAILALAFAVLDLNTRQVSAEESECTPTAFNVLVKSSEDSQECSSDNVRYRYRFENNVGCLPILACGDWKKTGKLKNSKQECQSACGNCLPLTYNEFKQAKDKCEGDSSDESKDFNKTFVFRIEDKSLGCAEIPLCNNLDSSIKQFPSQQECEDSYKYCNLFSTDQFEKLQEDCSGEKKNYEWAYRVDENGESIACKKVRTCSKTDRSIPLYSSESKCKSAHKDCPRRSKNDLLDMKETCAKADNAQFAYFTNLDGETRCDPIPKCGDWTFIEVYKTLKDCTAECYPCTPLTSDYISNSIGDCTDAIRHDKFVYKASENKGNDRPGECMKLTTCRAWEPDTSNFDTLKDGKEGCKSACKNCETGDFKPGRDPNSCWPPYPKAWMRHYTKPRECRELTDSCDRLYQSSKECQDACDNCPVYSKAEINTAKAVCTEADATLYGYRYDGKKLECGTINTCGLWNSSEMLYPNKQQCQDSCHNCKRLPKNHNEEIDKHCPAKNRIPKYGIPKDEKYCAKISVCSKFSREYPGTVFNTWEDCRNSCGYLMDDAVTPPEE